jgi:hypothetical protein
MLGVTVVLFDQSAKPVEPSESDDDLVAAGVAADVAQDDSTQVQDDDDR